MMPMRVASFRLDRNFIEFLLNKNAFRRSDFITIFSFFQDCNMRVEVLHQDKSRKFFTVQLYAVFLTKFLPEPLSGGYWLQKLQKNCSH